MGCDELYISHWFPPNGNVSGINVYKRILSNKRKVDIFQGNFNLSNGDFDEINKYIENKIYLDVEGELDTPDSILHSIKSSMNILGNDYKKIHSRSWVMQNHFIAFEYKLLNPDVIWTAEFSDPVILNISNKVRDSKKFNFNNQEYIDKVNGYITELNENENTSFPLIENNSSVFFLTEYLTYLFADKIIFTNENQMNIMLNQFDENIKQFVMDKSEIQMHPTLDAEFYHIKNVDLKLDKENINLAYFGHDYYGKRHFESLFYAVETLNHKFKDKIKVHLFIEDVNLIKNLIKPLKSSNNFTIRKPLNYFEFLNATTQFDVLIVNDVVTYDVWPINPYLPSKLSDYLGSSTDIWALYENGSTLSKFDLKYKSDISDFKSSRDQIIKILEDNGFGDENYSFDEDYFIKRLTTLNILYDTEFKRNSKLKDENKSLKRSNREILSSNSWKLTKPLRNFRNKK